MVPHLLVVHHALLVELHLFSGWRHRLLISISWGVSMVCGDQVLVLHERLAVAYPPAPAAAIAVSPIPIHRFHVVSPNAPA